MMISKTGKMILGICCTVIAVCVLILAIDHFLVRPDRASERELIALAAQDLGLTLHDPYPKAHRYCRDQSTSDRCQDDLVRRIPSRSVPVYRRYQARFPGSDHGGPAGLTRQPDQRLRPQARKHASVP